MSNAITIARGDSKLFEVTFTETDGKTKGWSFVKIS